MDIGPRTTVTICTAPSRMDLHPAVGSNDPWMLRSVAPRPHCHEEFVPGGKPSGAGQARTGAADPHSHARSLANVKVLGLTGSQLGLACWQQEAHFHAHDTTQIEKVYVEENETRSQQRTAADELEKILKIVLAYCMGYDKNLMWQDMYIGNLIASNLPHNN